MLCIFLFKEVKHVMTLRSQSLFSIEYLKACNSGLQIICSTRIKFFGQVYKIKAYLKLRKITTIIPYFTLILSTKLIHTQLSTHYMNIFILTVCEIFYFLCIIYFLLSSTPVIKIIGRRCNVKKCKFKKFF